MYPNVSYFQVGMKLVTCLLYPVRSLPSRYEMATCCMLLYSCFPLVTQLTQPDSGEVIITWGTLSPTFSRANFSSAGGWNAWVQKIPWCRPASPCPETRHMVSAGIMRHPDTSARITAIAWIQVWSFKLYMYPKRSFSLLHWPCSVVPGAQTSSYNEMRICTGASQHATGTVSWQNVRTCLEDPAEDVLGLVIYEVSRSAEVAEAMFWLTGWRMSTRCAEQWAENVRCNWPLAAAPKRPRSGYHQASHAHQSPSIHITFWDIWGQIGRLCSHWFLLVWILEPH